MPVYGSARAAGFDLHLSSVARPTARHLPHPELLPLGFESTEDGFWSLPPGGMAYAKSGLGFDIPDGHFLDIRGRSGWTGCGLVVLPGAIDADYIGEVGAHIANFGRWPIRLRTGMRLFQAVLLACGEQQTFEPADEKTWSKIVTGRGDAGHGSTGA